jgi:hypothetical protein
MKRTLVAARQLRLRAWVLLTLEPHEIAAALMSAMPMTVAELIEFARVRARECVEKCAHCGSPLLSEPPDFDEKAAKLPENAEPFTTNARAREENS